MKMVFLLGISVIWGSHPLMMMGGLMILVLSLFFYLYLSSTSFWLGYLLVLVMLSGILVVFSYMLSLIPNLSFEHFSLFLPFCLGLWIFKMGVDVSFLDTSSLVYGMWGEGLGIITLYLVSILLLLMVIVLFLSIMDKGCLRLI